MVTVGYVFVWHPQYMKGAIGHTSMWLLAGPGHDNPAYISWWPAETGARLFLPGVTDASAPRDSARADVATEEKDPDATFEIKLSQAAMWAKWDKIRTKEGSHYRVLHKNCSTIISRILIAGGANHILKSKRVLVWMPSDIEKLCDDLVAQGFATKVDYGTVPVALRWR